MHVSSGWAAAKSITCVRLSFCPNLSLWLLPLLDFVISLLNRFCFLMLKKRVPLCLRKTSCRVAEVFWVDARALPVCPCAGCFDKHDISCHLVHNIYIELSHTELRQKSPITHSLPSVVYTTKAFYLWSCFVQALEGIAVHCVTGLSVVFSCSVIQISVLCQQKGQ